MDMSGVAVDTAARAGQAVQLQLHLPVFLHDFHTELQQCMNSSIIFMDNLHGDLSICNIQALDSLADLIADRWKPDFKTTIVLVQRSMISNYRGLNLIKQCEVVKTFASPHKLSQAVAQQRIKGRLRPSDVLLCKISSTTGLVGTCNSIGEQEGGTYLKMVFDFFYV